MKTMNYLILITLMLFGASCSKQDSPEVEEPTAIDYRVRASEQVETQEVFAIDLQQYYLLGQIAKLSEEKRTLEEEIEGGNKYLVSDLETVLEKLHVKYEELNEVLNITCNILKLRLAVLERNIRNAEGESLAKLLEELSEIRWKLESCGVDVKEYVHDVFEEKGIKWAMSWGSKCNPGQEWKCKRSMEEGELLINVEEKLVNDIGVKFKSLSGKVISTGRLLGEHPDIKGMLQIGIELNQVNEGTLELSIGEAKIPIPIEIL